MLNREKRVLLGSLDYAIKSNHKYRDLSDNQRTVIKNVIYSSKAYESLMALANRVFSNQNLESYEIITKLINQFPSLLSESHSSFLNLNGLVFRSGAFGVVSAIPSGNHAGEFDWISHTGVDMYDRIDGCDRLKVGMCCGYQVLYSDIEKGEPVLFIPKGTIIAHWFGDRLGLFKKDVNRNSAGGYLEYNGRVKAIRIRGVQSEGIVIPIRTIKETFKIKEPMDDLVIMNSLAGITFVKRYTGDPSNDRFYMTPTGLYALQCIERGEELKSFDEYEMERIRFNMRSTSGEFEHPKTELDKYRELLNRFSNSGFLNL